MLENKRYRLARRMRLAARVIGLVAAGFTLTAFIVSGIFEFLTSGWEATTADIQGILLAVLAAIALASCIVSWWWERLAGILLILVAIVFGSYGGAIAGRHNIIVGLVLGLPYLVAGILFLTSWRFSRKPA